MFGNDYVKVSLCSVLASKPGQCSGLVSCRRSRLRKSRPVLSECAKLLGRRHRRRLLGGRLFISFSTAKHEPEKMLHAREHSNVVPCSGVPGACCMHAAWTLHAHSCRCLAAHLGAPSTHDPQPQCCPECFVRCSKAAAPGLVQGQMQAHPHPQQRGATCMALRTMSSWAWARRAGCWLRALQEQPDRPEMDHPLSVVFYRNTSAKQFPLPQTVICCELQRCVCEWKSWMCL